MLCTRLLVELLRGETSSLGPKVDPSTLEHYQEGKKSLQKICWVFFNYFYQQVKHANADGDRNGWGQE